MSEPSTKKLILCSMAGTLSAGLMLIALQIVLFVTLFILSTSGIITTSQAYKTLNCLPFSEKTAVEPLPHEITPANPKKTPIHYDYYTIKP